MTARFPPPPQAVRRTPWLDDQDQTADLEHRIAELERQLLGQWKPFTPTLTAATTNPTLGTGGVAQGRFIHVEALKLVIYRFFIQFGSSGANAGSGEYRISVPVDISAEDPANDTMSIGEAVLFDWSVAGHKELAVAVRRSASNLKLYVDNATVFHNNPILWTNNDRFGGEVTYETAG